MIINIFNEFPLSTFFQTEQRSKTFPWPLHCLFGYNVSNITCLGEYVRAEYQKAPFQKCFFFAENWFQVYVNVFYLFVCPFRRQLRSAVHDVLSGRAIGRRAKINAEKPDLSLAIRFDIMNSIVSNRHAPSKSDTFARGRAWSVARHRLNPADTIMGIYPPPTPPPLKSIESHFFFSCLFFPKSRRSLSASFSRNNRPTF